MRPMTNLVLIEVEPPQEITKSGLFIQEEWKTLPPTGIVKAVGPDVTTVVVGDKVIFERYASVILAEKNMRMCIESHILAKVFDAPTN